MKNSYINNLKRFINKLNKYGIGTSNKTMIFLLPLYIYQYTTVLMLYKEKFITEEEVKRFVKRINITIKIIFDLSLTFDYKFNIDCEAVALIDKKYVKYFIEIEYAMYDKKSNNYYVNLSKIMYNNYKKHKDYVRKNMEK